MKTWLNMQSYEFLGLKLIRIKGYALVTNLKACLQNQMVDQWFDDSLGYIY